MKLRVLLALMAPLGLLACGPREAAAPERAATATMDPSGAAPPQPNPNGGETPVGAAGPGGVSPNADEAARQGDPAAPGMTSPPKTQP
ncbi:hypothetical protein [Phenylobacterium sp.]|uniref:hypothetical protein n=1 Tax=Phenylobacterium sp. TaxID=1871053 RepID=UPI0025E0175E|nr:hypothetical protein [Phenylobacterium sp.]